LGRHRGDRPAGDLIGIGSLQLDQSRGEGAVEHLNMIVPIDLLKPILDDMLTLGRRNRPPRPWLGLYATEVDDRVVIVGLSGRGPAKRADLRTGDVVLAVDGAEVSDLAGLFRRIWSLGDAGVEVPMTVYRDGRTLDLRVTSADRRRFTKMPRLH
jgi:S1-C subfamily serine protease